MTFYPTMKIITVYTLLVLVKAVYSTRSKGPDPWDLQNGISASKQLPGDLALNNNPNSQATGDWFYKRLLAIILKAGTAKTNEDSSVSISVLLKIPEQHWTDLNDYITGNEAFTMEMYRRSIGYIEEAVCKPNIIKRIVTSWSEYIGHYLKTYKTEITWSTSGLAGIITAIYIAKTITRKTAIILFFICLYLYESVLSYKEAEKKDILSALSKCGGWFWKTECQVIVPDLLVFLKHLHPAVILARILTIFITEPLKAINSTCGEITEAMTDGLWEPFRSSISGVLRIALMIIIYFISFIMVTTILFKSSLNLNFFYGLFHIGLERKQSPRSNSDQRTIHGEEFSRASSTNQISSIVEPLTRNALNGGPLIDSIVFRYQRDRPICGERKNIDSVDSRSRIDVTPGKRPVGRSLSAGRLDNRKQIDRLDIDSSGDRLR